MLLHTKCTFPVDENNWKSHPRRDEYEMYIHRNLAREALSGNFDCELTSEGKPSQEVHGQDPDISKEASSHEGKPLKDDATRTGDAESETAGVESGTVPMQVDNMPSKSAYVDMQKDRPPNEDQDPEREKVRKTLLRPAMREKDPRR